MASHGSKLEDDVGTEVDSKKPNMLATVLGCVMITGGTLYKLPQILKIHQAKSSQGISLSSTILAMMSHVFTLAYSVSEGHPFSTYGEAFPQFACTLGIALQCLRYDLRFSAMRLSQAAGASLASAFLVCRSDLLLGTRRSRQVAHAMQSALPPLTLVEKMPQVLQTWRSGSAGELSVATSLLGWLGNWIRCYTSVKSLKHDTKALIPHAVGFFINLAIMAQIMFYKRKSASLRPASAGL